eukprot:5649726-Amphidinium_carterae.1
MPTAEGSRGWRGLEQAKASQGKPDRTMTTCFPAASNSARTRTARDEQSQAWTEGSASKSFRKLANSVRCKKSSLKRVRDRW